MPHQGIQRRVAPAYKLKKVVGDIVCGTIVENLSKEFYGQKVFVKIYPKNNIKDPLQTVYRRLNLITDDNNNLSPKARWVETENAIVTIQKLLTSPQNRVLTLNELEAVAKKLDCAHGLKLVHGDINIKNVIFSEGSTWIVDWEPSLKQIKNGSVILMATFPYIHRADRKQNKLTTLTDLLGFYFLVNINTHGRDGARELAHDHNFLNKTYSACDRLFEHDSPFTRLLSESQKSMTLE